MPPLTALIAILVLGLAPGIFWLWYFYRRDTWEHEPRSLVAKTFLYGAVVTVVAVFIEVPFLFSELLLSVIIAPVVEELCKFAVVRLRVYKRAEFNEPVDGIVYAAAAALGFAAVENVFYLGGTFFDIGVVVFTATFVIRALISVPSHAIFSSMWGYALGLAKCTPKAQTGHIVLTGVLLAILLHGIFNFLALSGLLFALGMLVFVPVGWVLVNNRIKRALSISPFNPARPPGIKYCPACGTATSHDARFCPDCGAQFTQKPFTGSDASAQSGKKRQA